MTVPCPTWAIAQLRRSASARFRRTTIADSIAAALDPETTGVAVLVDAGLADALAAGRAR